MNNAAEFAGIIKKFDDGRFYKTLQEATKSTYMLSRLEAPFLTEEEVKEMVESTLSSCLVGSLCIIPELSLVLFASLGDEFIKDVVDNLKLKDCMEV